MMPNIRMPDGQVVQFPDTMTDVQIRGLIASKYPKAVGEAGAAKAPEDRDVSGHYAFDASNIPGFNQETGTVPDPYDTSKSFGAGLRRGVEGIAGSFGDLAQLGGNVAGWAGGKLGASPEMQQTISGVASKATPFALFPTTQDIQQNITNPIGGEGYQPETTAGKYAGTMGEFGTGALAPGGPFRKAMMMAAPAVASETAGQLTEGTAYEPYARLAGALAGGAITVPKLGGKPIAAAASDLGVSKRDVTRVIKRMQQDGMSPEDINAALAKLGPDATLMDVGSNLRQEGQRIYAQGGRGRGIINDVLEPRDQTANARIRGEIDTNLGPAPIPSRVDAELKAGQKALSPEYERVLGQAKAVNTEPIANDITSMIANTRGEARTALEKVRGMLRIEGTDALDPHPRAALATRQAIDGMMESTTDGNVRRILGDFRKRLDNELSTAAPGIKEVDAKYADLANQRRAVERGQTVLDGGRSSPVPAELADEVAKGGPAIQSRLAQGARAEIERIVGTNANDRVALQRIIKGEGDWNRQKLATLFGQDKADNIIAVLDREGEFANTSNRVMKNSATAERLPEAGIPGLDTVNAYKAGGILGALRATGVKGIEAVIDKVRGAAADARGANVAKLLSETDRAKITTALIKANGGKPLPQDQVDQAIRALLITQESASSTRQ